MITLGDYLVRRGESAAVGRTFLTGGEYSLVVRIKEFYDNPNNRRERRISGDIEQRGRMIHFGDLGPVAAWSDAKETIFIPGDFQ